LLLACSKQPSIDNETMLDGNKIKDPSVEHPEKYLVSFAIPNPTALEKQKPVIIAVHGYSATTYEWNEFRAWSESVGKYLVSQVLLGGHGRDYETFKKATWLNWQQPIIDEYLKLVALGFTNINIIGSSTACPLMLNIFSNNKLGNSVNPKHIFMIDPIIIPSSKTLAIADIVGPALGYVSSGLDSSEEGYWYSYRPQESLNQLLNLLTTVRKELENGIVLPQGSDLKVYKSIKDASADPVSAVLIYKGVRNANNSRINIEMEDSDLHVFTRLNGRNSFSVKDKALQLKVFNDIASIIEN
jgi:carboxylesterase